MAGAVVLALAFVGLLAASPSSTAVDRMALYLVPLQLFVLSRVPDALGRDPTVRRLLTLGIVAYCGAVEFVWLNFADHAENWVPYRSFIQL